MISVAELLWHTEQHFFWEKSRWQMSFNVKNMFSLLLHLPGTFILGVIDPCWLFWQVLKVNLKYFTKVSYRSRINLNGLKYIVTFFFFSHLE